MLSKLLFTRIGRFKLVAWLEGISFLVLLFIAMPLKYVWGQPWLVQNIGMIHGILFILYLLYLVQANIELRWNVRKTLIAAAASFIPFGTFYVDLKMLPRTVEGAERK